MVIWFFACVVVLLVSGAYKVRDPAPTATALRAVGVAVAPGVVVGLGVAEIVTAIYALVFGGAPVGWLVAGFYAGFAVFVAVSLRRDSPVGSCGCFGETERPPTVVHLGIDLAGMIGAGWYATSEAVTFTETVVDGALAAPIALGLTLVGAIVVIRLITGGKPSRPMP